MIQRNIKQVLLVLLLTLTVPSIGLAKTHKHSHKSHHRTHHHTNRHAETHQLLKDTRTPPETAPIACVDDKSKCAIVKSDKYKKIVGMASWYGPGFHGRKTASGERFNQHALTAAHKTLPLGTLVQVRNLDNNRSVVVTINDRGPFVRGRVIDLSRGAAQKIGLASTEKVEITVIGRG